MSDKKRIDPKVVLSIYKRDIKNIIKNPVTIIVVLGLIILPSLYAWVNIVACWDPYSNTSGIQVAIVNLDEGVDFGNEVVNAGEMIVNNLKENHSIGWQFVDKSDAEYGLTHNKYYAMMEIPADFSKRLVDVFDGVPQKPEIIYRVNEKSNAVAPKITDTGAKTVTNEVTRSIIEVVDKAAFSVSNQLGEDMNDNKNKIVTVRDAVLTVSGHFAEIEAGLDKAEDSMEMFNNLLADVDQSLPEVEKGIASLKDFSVQSNLLLDDAQSIQSEVVRYLDDKFDEVLGLSADLEKLLKAARNSTDDLEALRKKAPEIIDKAQRLQMVLEKIMDFLTPYQDLSPDYQLLRNQLEIARKGLAALNEAFSAINDNSAVTKTFLTELLQNNDQLLQKQIAAIKTITEDTRLEMAETLPEYLGRVAKFSADGLTMETQLLQQEALNLQKEGALYPVKYPMLPFAQLQKDLGRVVVDIEVNQGENLGEILEAVKNDEQMISAQLPDCAAKTTAELTQALEKLTEASENNKALLEKLQMMSDKEFAAQLAVIKDKLLFGDELLTKSQALLEELEKKGFSVGSIVAGLSNIDSQLKDALDKIDGMLDVVDDGLGLANRAFDVAETTSGEIETAIEQLRRHYDERWETIISTIFGDLESSLDNLDNILLSADDALPQLNELLANGKDASGKGRDVLDVVAADLPAIRADVSRLSQLFGKLNDDNLDLLIELLQNDPDAMSDYFSGPVALTEERLYHLNNYGSAMAPFYTILALWVGCLILCAVLTVEAKPLKAGEPLKIMEEYFGKMLIFLTLTILQALVVAVGDKYLLGITVTDFPLFLGFCFLSSIIFTLIVYTMVSVLGTVGKAVCVIFLVLQIAGAGGTFPVEVMPRFYQIIQPFLPFTYSIGALREAVAGPMADNLWYDFKMLLLFGIIALLIGLTLKKPLHPLIEWFNKKFAESGIGE